MNKKHIFVSLVVTGLTFSQHSKAGPPLDATGWPIVPPETLKEMSQNQIRFNMIGDMIRNSASYILNMFSLTKPEEATQMVMEKMRDDLVEDAFKNKAPPNNLNDLTNIAKAYDRVINMETPESPPVIKTPPKKKYIRQQPVYRQPFTTTTPNYMLPPLNGDFR